MRKTSLHFVCPKCGARRYVHCNNSPYVNYTHLARRELARKANELPRRNHENQKLGN